MCCRLGRVSPSDIRPQASYFPINERPFKMTAGLYRLGHDFGNGEVDAMCFQKDEFENAFRAKKIRILDATPERLSELEDADAMTCKRHVFEWMTARLKSEHGIELHDSSLLSRNTWRELSLAVQEDFAIVHQPSEGIDRIILLSVCFPSGWAPETLLGASFRQTHAPVPEFGDLEARRARLVSAMIHRGPYVRFVWSVTADARLDHHPVDAPRDPWHPTASGFLRVERQVTVPFSDCSASLFLIRTYVYPLTYLSREQRVTLAHATSALPPSMLAYKGITEVTLEVLEAATRA